MARAECTIKKNLIKDMLSYLFLIGCAVCWLLIFILIFLYDTLWIGEPNMVILILEIALCVGMLALGIERLYNFIKVNKKGNDKS